MLRKRTIIISFDDDYISTRKAYADCLTRLEAPLIHTLPACLTDDRDDNHEEAELWHSWFPVAQVVAVYCDAEELPEDFLKDIYNFHREDTEIEFRIFSEENAMSEDLIVVEGNNNWQVKIPELNICENDATIVGAINKVKHALSLTSD